MQKLKDARVLIVGLGGVGGYAAEQLCRAGLGNLTLVDGDTIHPSNRNRQLIALKSTEGMYKAVEFEKRCKDINPNCNISVINEFIRDDRMIEILENNCYDHVVDAIDTLSPKVFLLYHCFLRNIKIVSSMGSGGKMDPSQIKVDDISKSYNCPLAHMVRKRLHKLNIHSGIKVVYSPEKVPEHAIIEDPSTNKRTTIGTISYMPPIFGCYCASVVIRDLIST